MCGAVFQHIQHSHPTPTLPLAATDTGGGGGGCGGANGVGGGGGGPATEPYDFVAAAASRWGAKVAARVNQIAARFKIKVATARAPRESSRTTTTTTLVEKIDQASDSSILYVVI